MTNAEELITALDAKAWSTDANDWVVSMDDVREIVRTGLTFTCAARRGKTDPPQDCDWPCCGCDPHADKVIEALQESGKLASPPAPSGWQQRIAALQRYSEGEVCMHPSPGGKWVLLANVQDALQEWQHAKDAHPLLPEGALEAAFREGYDFGQADAGFEVVDASDAWRKSGTGQNAKDAIPSSSSGTSNVPDSALCPRCGFLVFVAPVSESPAKD